MKHKLYITAFIFVFLVSCDSDSKHTAAGSSDDIKQDGSIKYAKRFAIRYSKDATRVYLFGNKANFDTTATYVVSNGTSKTTSIAKNTYYIKSPCKKIAALSSIYASIFFELGMLENLVAIDNIDYVCNPEIIQKHKQHQLRELAKMPQLDLEQTVALNPDIIFTFGMGEGEKDKDKKLEQTNIPIAISVDHLEESPLARAEWIKFFAAFVNKKEKADSIFATVEKDYLALKSKAEKTNSQPSVFSEIKYSDSWYVPGGKSYVAKLLKDAGANYLWKEDVHFGSLPLSFEQVYARAKNADYWINLSTIKSKQELLSYEMRYIEFNAFKKGNLYNNNKVTNALGYSTYWETGMIYPNKILNDLILIFHPELKSQQQNELFYYRKLN